VHKVEMELVIRCAVPAEAARLTDLARAAKACWGYPAAWLAAWAADLAITPEYVGAHRVFAAEIAGELVGVCAVEDLRERWALEHVWVARVQHGRGIGQALVWHALEAARAHRPGVVQVTSDPHAAGFYERLGARRVGAVPAPMVDAPARELPLFEFLVAATENHAATG
jgi:predicted N-acetyltransferase YhbS